MMLKILPNSEENNALIHNLKLKLKLKINKGKRDTELNVGFM